MITKILSIAWINLEKELRKYIKMDHITNKQFSAIIVYMEKIAKIINIIEEEDR